jgi:hypothetical protein
MCGWSTGFFFDVVNRMLRKRCPDGADKELTYQ